MVVYDELFINPCYSKFYHTLTLIMIDAVYLSQMVN